MPRVYLVLPDAASANALANRLNNSFGYPNARTKTERYTQPLQHPSGSRYLVIILDTDGGSGGPLNASERSALIDEAEARAQGWFPEVS